MNLAVIHDPSGNDHMDDHPRIHDQELLSFKQVGSHRSLSKSPSKQALNFDMLCNVNLILSKVLYGNCLFFEYLCKYLITRFNIAGQFVPWYVAKSWK